MERERIQRAREVANVLADYINTLDSQVNDRLVHQLAGMHPTLQQNFTRLCVAWFKKLAEKPLYDDRIKASVMLAKKLKPELDTACLPHI